MMQILALARNARRSVCYLAILLLGVALFGDTLPATADDDANILWGDVVNGLRIGLKDVPAEFSADKELEFTIVVQNVSDGPLTIADPRALLPRRTASPPHVDEETPLSTLVVVSNAARTGPNLMESSSYRPRKEVLPWPQGTPPPIRQLQSGETITWANLPLESLEFSPSTGGPPAGHITCHTRLLGAGSRYRIGFQYQLEKGQIPSAPVWTGSVKTGMAEIEIKTPPISQYKLSADLTLPGSFYFAGQPLPGTFRIFNHGTEPVRFTAGADYRNFGRPNRYSVSAWNIIGVPAIDPHAFSFMAGNGGGLGGGGETKPGAPYKEVVPLEKWCTFYLPGIYTLTSL